MNARLLLLAALFAADTQAAVPKNTQVQYSAENATINYASAPWRTEVKGVEIYRCDSGTLETCTAHLSMLPPANHTIEISGPGIWRLDFLKEITQTWYGSIQRSIKWSQYVAVLPTPTPAILQAAAKYTPKLSISDSEGYYPVTIATLFERPASSIGSKRLLPASELSDIAESDTIADVLRFNGHRENKLTLNKVVAADIKGDSSNFPVYWFHQEDAENVWITYFLLFGFDKKHYSAAGDHALDRESISIKLQKTGTTLTPISVIYAGHLEDQPVSFRGCTSSECTEAGTTEIAKWTGGRTAVPWAKAAKANDHPIAYVARGSHAMYPGFGWYRLSVSWWPDLTEAAGALTTKTLRSGDLTRVDLNDPMHSALTFSGYLVEGPIDWYRSFPFIRFPTDSWASNVNQAFGICVADSRGCEQYIESISEVQSFGDTFDGPIIDNSKWIAGSNGGHPISVGIANSEVTLNNSFLETRGKMTFSARKIVIESRMRGPGSGRDTAILLVDAATSETIVMHDTTYGNWGFAANGSGKYNFLEVERPAGVGPAPQNCTALGQSTTAYMEYRLTINENIITIERGSTLANISQTATRTLGASIVGKTFYLVVGSGVSPYTPAAFDWVRVAATQ